MAKSLVLLLALALAGCTATPRATTASSACSGGENSYACQVERYGNAGM